MENKTTEEMSSPGGEMPSDVVVLASTQAFVDTVTNATRHMSKIFLQTSFAQGIAGAFIFAAMLLTCWQVSIQ